MSLARAEYRYLQPPDPTDPVCRNCQHSIDCHQECECKHGCDNDICVFRDCECDHFVELDPHEAAEDHAFDLADQAWAERGL